MVNQVVFHQKFGRGIITNIKQVNNKFTLSILFDNSEKKDISYSKNCKFVTFEDFSKQTELDNIIQKIEEDLYKKAQAEEAERLAKIAAAEAEAAKVASIVKSDIGDFETIRSNRNLEAMEKYGKSAQKIYDICCSIFDWDENLRTNFGTKKTFYASDATTDNYSVWFIDRSNFSGSKIGCYTTEISTDFNFIRQHEEASNLEIGEIRIIFAKDENEAFVFLGTYKCNAIDKNFNTKIFERFSEKITRK